MRAESGSKQRPAEYNLPRSKLPEISGGGHSNSQIFCPPIRDPWVLGSHISRSQENRGANYIGRICGRYPDMSASSSESRSCCSLLASLFPKAFVSKLHFRGHREQARPIQMID